MAALDHLIEWDQRLDFNNHVPHFPFQVTGTPLSKQHVVVVIALLITKCIIICAFKTGAVDTIAIEVQTPKDPAIRRGLYHGKYHACVIKFLIVCDLKGRICFADGPFPGTIFDAHLFRDTMPAHPLHPLEFLLGDGHFTSLPQILAPHRRRRVGRLNDSELQWNNIVAFYRSRFAQKPIVYKIQ